MKIACISINVVVVGIIIFIVHCNIENMKRSLLKCSAPSSPTLKMNFEMKKSRFMIQPPGGPTRSHA